MIVEGEVGIDSDTNIDELGNFSDDKGRCQGREVAADHPVCRVPSSASCWGLMKDHDLGFVGVDS